MEKNAESANQPAVDIRQTTVDEGRAKKWTKFCNDQEQRYAKWIQKRVRFSEWLDDTTFHGIVHVFKATSFIRRFIWAIVFLGAAAGCLYSVIDRIIVFSRIPSATTVSLLSQPEGIPFPAVTFCNLNLIRRSVAENTGFLDIARSLNSLDVGQCRRFAGNLTSPTVDKPLRELLRNGSQTVDEFVLSCIFTGLENVDYLDCTSMLVPTLTDLGYCYTFNSQVDSPELLVRNTGSRYGLDVLLNVSQSDYLPILNGAGVRVAIHPRGVPPEPDERGIAVPPQRSAFIGLRTTNVIDESTRRSCQVRDQRTLPFFPRSSYSLPACRLNVMYEQVARVCCCIALVNDTQISTEQYSQNCNTSNLPNCTVGDSCCLLEQSLLANPGAGCPSACNSFNYETSTSYAAYPSMSGAAQFSRTLGESVDNINSNLLSVTIFFEEPYIERVRTENSYSITALLSDIGGQLGLFLGASVISLIEFAWFIFDDIYDLFQRCFTKKKKIKITQQERDIAINTLAISGDSVKT